MAEKKETESIKKSTLGRCEICRQSTDVHTEYSETKEHDIWVCEDCKNKVKSTTTLMHKESEEQDPQAQKK